jgi:hypothetical protein
MGPVALPHIVKHCTKAIYDSGDIRGRSQKDKFLQCMLVATSRLQQYGFIIMGPDGVAGEVSLTSKGRLRELEHANEGRAKSVWFDSIYRRYDFDGARKRELEKAKARTEEVRSANQQNAVEKHDKLKQQTQRKP